MRLLLDTHALLWWLENHPLLSPAANDAIADPDNDISVSAVSAFEVTQKVRLGKLPDTLALAEAFDQRCLSEGFTLLPLSVHHAALAGSLLFAHRDPFDRMLIAQAQLEGMLLVSNEKIFDGFGVRRLW